MYSVPQNTKVSIISRTCLKEEMFYPIILIRSQSKVFIQY